MTEAKGCFLLVSVGRPCVSLPTTGGRREGGGGGGEGMEKWRDRARVECGDATGERRQKETRQRSCETRGEERGSRKTRGAGKSFDLTLGIRSTTEIPPVQHGK